MNIDDYYIVMYDLLKFSVKKFIVFSVLFCFSLSKTEQKQV